jgi:WD40 repeat protein
MGVNTSGTVFLSHASDLADYPADRSYIQAATEAVLRAGFRPVDMSQFTAASHAPAEHCEQRVRECDVYLGVIGFRYGSCVPNREDRRSYTEIEFLAATRAQIPRLIFVLHEDAPLPSRLIDPDRRDIDAFRDQLIHAGVMIRWVMTPADLGEAVLQALYELQAEHQYGLSGAAIESPQVSLRRPWMAPPLDRMIERPELGSRLVEALCVPGRADVGLTTGLRGAGGFGKTKLASWVTHQPEIAQRYPGGLLWITIGQEVHGPDLAERINDLAYLLDGKRPAISEPDVAGAELGRLLDRLPPVLMVIDDIWDEPQLRPFRYGGRDCTRLVTTRIPDVLPSRSTSIAVDEMSASQASQLVSDGVDGLSAQVIDLLTRAAGRWPVLLNLINGALRHRVAHGEPPDRAATDVLELLARQGPAALDAARPTDRARAITATIDASLRLLDSGDLERYLDLAIFPEDVDIPISILELMWPGCQINTLCEELVNLGLIADYRLDQPGPRVVLHDVIRVYLRARRGHEDLCRAHSRLVLAARKRLPSSHESTSIPWWLLPATDSYLWRFLPYHLAEARQTDRLATLVCDLRWIEAKTRLLGSVTGAAADVALVDTEPAQALGHLLSRAARLFGPIQPMTALAATLASRLHGVPELATILEQYLPYLTAPRLQPLWPLPDQVRASADDGSIPTGAMTSSAFSPDGALLATAAGDGAIRFWRISDYSLLSTLSGHTGEIFYCTFSPDSDLIAAASSDGRVWIWELANHALWTILVNPDWVTSCVFSPDGRLIATASNDGTVRVWLVADGTLLTSFVGHAGRATDCAFSPDGTRLASTGFDATARIWDVDTGQSVTVLRGHSSSVWGCAFSPDGALLATTGHDGTVRLWTSAGWSETAVLTGPDMWMRKCAFSPDGTLLAAAAGDGTVPVWRVSELNLCGGFTAHTDWVRECHFSADGRLIATTGFDGTVRLWDLATGSEQVTLGGSAARMNGCAISPDGTSLASAGNDHAVHLYETSSGREVTALIGHSDWVRDCAYSPDGKRLATVGSDGVTRLWSVETQSEWAVLRGHTDRIRRCAFSGDGRLLATASSDRTARIWDVSTGRTEKIITGHQEWVDGCAFSPDSTTLATTGFDMKARLWRAPEWTELAVLSGHTDCVTGCAFSPDGTRLATVSDDQTARIWRVATGDIEAVLSGHTGWVESCAFSPDGNRLATVSSDQTIRLWNLDDYACECALRVAAPLLGVAWHPGSTNLCAVGDAGIYMFAYHR